MRRGLGLLGLLVTIVIVAVVGVVAYQAGWSDGFAQHVPANSTAVAGPYPYYYGPHFFGFGWGFGWLFGLLFFFFVLFVIFRVIGLAIWGGRWGYGRRGWGHYYGGGVPPAIDERMKEWHRQAHGEPPSGSTAPPPPPTTA